MIRRIGGKLVDAIDQAKGITGFPAATKDEFVRPRFACEDQLQHVTPNGVGSESSSQRPMMSGSR